MRRIFLTLALLLSSLHSFAQIQLGIEGTIGNAWVQPNVRIRGDFNFQVAGGLKSSFTLGKRAGLETGLSISRTYIDVRQIYYTGPLICDICPSYFVHRTMLGLELPVRFRWRLTHEDDSRWTTNVSGGLLAGYLMKATDELISSAHPVIGPTGVDWAYGDAEIGVVVARRLG